MLFFLAPCVRCHLQHMLIKHVPDRAKKSQKVKIRTAGVPMGEVECADKSNCYFRKCIITFFLTQEHNILVYTCQILIQLFKRHQLHYFSGFLDVAQGGLQNKKYDLGSNFLF